LSGLDQKLNQEYQNGFSKSSTNQQCQQISWIYSITKVKRACYCVDRGCCCWKIDENGCFNQKLIDKWIINKTRINNKVLAYTL
jgi:hypothetical protein